MNWETIQQIVRKIADILVGVLAAQGLVTQEMAPTIAAAIVAIIGWGWWFYFERKRLAEKAASEAAISES